MAIDIGRRQVIFAIGGMAVAWPLAARAQAERARRIAVLMLYPESDSQGQLRAAAFRKELENLGWTVGGNLQIDFHWGTGDSDWIRSATARLLASAPDVIVANGDAAARIVQQSTTSVPVIFIVGGDPVAGGLVQSLAHPGGNVTGFTVLEPSVGAKLLELLKGLAPGLARVAVLFSPDNLGNRRTFESAKAAAPKFAVEVTEAPWRGAAEFETAMNQWGQLPDFGLIVPPDPAINAQRALFIALAAHHRLPVIYTLGAAAAEGGLISYGVDIPELFRQAGTYVSRILKGEKPSDLPAQLPTKFELVINLKTAKTLGLAVPDKLLATADEVIE
jgi:putative tryptophan/tyrosine transport system substrate-binding protein